MLSIVYKVILAIKSRYNKYIVIPSIKDSLGSCGENVSFAENLDFLPPSNIYIGNNSVIGANARFWTTLAKIHIGDKVMFGPDVTIITGNHRTDVIGKYMIDIGESYKQSINDEDVIIEKDVWVGANVTILKGVKISSGCIIGAGSVVVKSTEPYGIYVGNPAKLIKKRFTDDELIEHKQILNIE